MIDSHFHLWTTDESTPEKRAERAEQIRREMELNDVDRIALIGDVGTTIEECRECNRIVAKYVKEYPDLFYGWARVDPRVDGAVEEFRRAVEENGLVGLKHHFMPTTVNISDPEFFPIAEAAVDMDVPIIAHVMQRLETDKENWDDSEAYTEDVMELAQRYPDLKLISAHIVAGGDPEYRIKNVEDQENVILDISGSNTETGNVEMAAERLGTNRLVHGTDTWFSPGVGKIKGLDLSPEEKADIAFNFENLLREDVPNRYSDDELAERKEAAREMFASVGDDRDECSIVDADAFVGEFPFRKLDASPERVVSMIDEKGVDKALVSAPQAATYRNPHAANRELVGQVEGHKDRLIPVATLNPTYTAWRKDLRESVEDLGMKAVKLLPLYHDYDLNDPAAKELLDAAADHDIPVIIAATLEDQRQRHPRMTLRGHENGITRNFNGEHIDQLVELLRDSPEADVIIANAWNNAERIVEETCRVRKPGVRMDNQVRSGEVLFTMKDLFLYFSHQVEELAENVGVDHLVHGSMLPLYIFEASYNAVELLPVSDEDKERVTSGNVLSLIE